MIPTVEHWIQHHEVEGSSSTNVMKLFLSVMYGFSYLARVFVRLGWKSLPGTKHSSLVAKFLNYGRIKFYNIAPSTVDLRELISS
jgi:hypothetical protein